MGRHDRQQTSQFVCCGSEVAGGGALGQQNACTSRQQSVSRGRAPHIQLCAAAVQASKGPCLTVLTCHHDPIPKADSSEYLPVLELH